MSLFYEVPRRIVPEHIEQAVRDAREARDAAADRDRPAMQAAFDAAVKAATDFVAEVGVDKVEVPMAAQKGGREALEQFHFAQRELRREKAEE